MNYHDIFKHPDAECWERMQRIKAEQAQAKRAAHNFFDEEFLTRLCEIRRKYNEDTALE